MTDVVFVSNTCPSCHIVADALSARPIPGVSVLNIDVSSSARASFDRIGTKAVPTALIGGKAVVGAYAILAALRAKYGAP